VALAWSTRALPQEQRRLAVNLGGLGFMILRAMLAFALFVCLKLAGFGLFCGLLLLWAAVAVSLRAEAPPADPPPPRRALGAALVSLLAADAPAALFSMLALTAAAQGSRHLVMFGLALAIPLLALGSAQFITILRKPPLLWLNAAFLGWLGGGVAARDPFWAGTAMPLDLLGDFAPPVGAVVALLLAYIALRGRNIQKVPDE
jgi:predicted tellurium resistance membrane protein TerC